MISLKQLFRAPDPLSPDHPDNREKPFLVGCVSPTPTRLHGQHFACHSTTHEHDRRLYIVQGLTPLHLLTGDGCILVTEALGRVLSRCCPDRVELLPADIHDTRTGQHLTGYRELRAHDQLAFDEVEHVRDPTPRVWQCHAGHTNLFVTKPVIGAIRDAQIFALRFDPGLSGFIN